MQAFRDASKIVCMSLDRNEHPCTECIIHCVECLVIWPELRGGRLTGIEEVTRKDFAKWAR